MPTQQSSTSAAQNPTAADRRRRQILDEAARLFDERGYHTTSMEDIAEAVGIRKPTLYHYFRSKVEILDTVYQETIGELIARQEQRATISMTPEQRVLETMADVLETIDARHGHVRVFFEHHRELPEDRHEEIMARRERYHQELVAIIQTGIDDGTFRPELDPQLAALLIFGACNWAYQWYRPGGPLRARDLAYAFWDMLVRGMENADRQR